MVTDCYLLKYGTSDYVDQRHIDENILELYVVEMVSLPTNI